MVYPIIEILWTLPVRGGKWLLEPVEGVDTAHLEPHRGIGLVNHPLATLKTNPVLVGSITNYI